MKAAISNSICLPSDRLIWYYKDYQGMIGKVERENEKVIEFIVLVWVCVRRILVGGKVIRGIF